MASTRPEERSAQHAQYAQYALEGSTLSPGSTPRLHRYIGKIIEQPQGALDGQIQYRLCTLHLVTLCYAYSHVPPTRARNITEGYLSGNNVRACISREHASFVSMYYLWEAYLLWECFLWAYILQTCI
jgi:hypothetical protein